ncbi:hypothetical protein EC950183_4278, partial [Escherichia coli 95.0183]
MSTVFSLSL